MKYEWLEIILGYIALFVVFMTLMGLMVFLAIQEETPVVVRVLMFLVVLVLCVIEFCIVWIYIPDAWVSFKSTNRIEGKSDE